MDKTIDLSGIIAILKRFWWVVAILGVIGMGVSFMYTNHFVEKQYEATSQVLVKPEKNEDNRNFDVQLNKQLLGTYQVIITSGNVLNQVRDKLDLKESNKELASRISVTNEASSQVLVIGVRDNEPEKAVLIVNTLSEILQKEAEILMDEKNVRVLSPAELKNSQTPVSPNLKMSIALGFVAGVGLAITLFVVIELTNTKLRTREDVEAFVEIPILGSVEGRKL
ncbi:Wzz/FepE/Etk N-terminal domain-containing protein [Listeria rocourtiae]|uniref:YveK family protein n=1 Tax=Listeria rocourtiae TaxID=647910 RepID=UPI003D2F5AA5